MNSINHKCLYCNNSFIKTVHNRKYCSEDCAIKDSRKRRGLRIKGESNVIEDLVNEKWFPVKGYDGKYLVSNLGRIKSSDFLINTGIRNSKKITRYGRLITSKNLPNGYLFVMLYKDNKSKMHLIHRMVAEAFISNPEEHPVVNHIDFNKSNNNVCNLEWCTYKQNTHHALDGGKMWMGEK